MKTEATLNVTTPTEREVVMTRVFDAPAARVFAALTTPALLRRWYGPPGWSMTVCEIDLRVGGAWRFVSSRPDGRAVGQKGVYREIVPARRLVNTEAWEDWDAGETLVTTTLDEHTGRTTLTSTMLFPSRDVRDTVLHSGLRQNAGALWDKLAALLAEGVAL